MPTVRYTTVNGEIIAEKRNGVRRLYVPDPLGSTVALLDNTQTQSDTFSYWPYGEEKSRTGTTPTPFRHGGSTGYYTDGGSRAYVRKRHYLKTLGRWVTVDPLWPDEAAYAYAANSPLVFVDPSGNTCAIPFFDCTNVPGGACEYARSRGDDKTDGDPDWGGTICCNNQPVACVWYRGGNECVRQCIRAHEHEHLKYMDCTNIAYGRRNVPPVANYPGLDHDECEAYHAELGCLLACQARHRGWRDAFCSACRRGRAACKGAGMGFPFATQCKRERCRGF
jgi:RHS repeat-associated protein